MLGEQGDVQNLIVAQPPPSLVPSFAPPANVQCGKDKKVQLDIVAQNIAFDPTCLVADAGKPFTVNFDNEDAGTPHNIDIFDEQGGTSLASTPVQNGPTKETLPVNALDAGSYFFQCDVHPQQMTGTLAVVK
jgi:plastocyanin